MKLIVGKGSLVLAALAALAGGCRSDSASYMIKGADLSLTLIVDQTYLWEEEWQIGLLTTRQPECMRRHSLQPAPIKGFKLEVFQAADSAYIVKEGANWYVAEMQKCQLQQFKAPPAEPGELRGSFEFQEGKLGFLAAPKPAEPPAVPAAAAPAAPAAPPPTTVDAAPAPTGR